MMASRKSREPDKKKLRWIAEQFCDLADRLEKELSSPSALAVRRERPRSHDWWQLKQDVRWKYAKKAGGLLFHAVDAGGLAADNRLRRIIGWWKGKGVPGPHNWRRGKCFEWVGYKWPPAKKLPCVPEHLEPGVLEADIMRLLATHLREAIDSS